MQGSPLLRTLLTTALLLVAAVVLVRITSVSAKSPTVTLPDLPKVHQTQPDTSSPVPFELVLSAPAAEVRLLDGNDHSIFQSKPETTTVSATLARRPASIVVQVKWLNQTPGHRFARLSLEPAGEDTLRHIFEGSGDLDEFWELPTAP